MKLGDTRVAVSAAGDLAAIWGPLNVVIETPGGRIALDNKFVAVWQKRGDAWKVIENSWNDNAPAVIAAACSSALGVKNRVRARIDQKDDAAAPPASPFLVHELVLEVLRERFSG